MTTSGRGSDWAVVALSVLGAVALVAGLAVMAHEAATGEATVEGVERDLLLHWSSAARVADVRTPTPDTTVCINGECHTARRWHELSER